MKMIAQGVGACGENKTFLSEYISGYPIVLLKKDNGYYTIHFPKTHEALQPAKLRSE